MWVTSGASLSFPTVCWSLRYPCIRGKASQRKKIASLTLLKAEAQTGAAFSSATLLVQTSHKASLDSRKEVADPTSLVEAYKKNDIANRWDSF